MSNPVESNINFHKTHFIKSVPEAVYLPEDDQIEIAFAGRSNSGKSSIINRLCSQKTLARVSKTPGRTQALNFFEVEHPTYLVDLPGYGYAKVSHSAQAKWEHFLMSYILERRSLVGIILIMDSRHPFTDIDELFLDLCERAAHPCHILLNKVDKLSRKERDQTWQKVQNKLMIFNNENFSAEFFSAQTGFGLAELNALLNRWISEKKIL